MRWAAAFEFRHPSWFTEPVFDLLRRHNAALCIAESDKLSSPPAITADFVYYRFRRSEYSADDRSGIVDRLREAGTMGQLVFAFLKHEERPESALWAEEILKAVGGMASAGPTR